MKKNNTRSLPYILHVYKYQKYLTDNRVRLELKTRRTIFF